MENLFQGKVAIITGGGSGIGQAAAALYAGYGAKVVVSDLNGKGAHETLELVRKAGGEAVFIKADVSKASEVEAMVKQTIKQYGRLDIAFNNAGIGGEMANIADMSVEGWQKVIDVNLSGVFYCMKYEIPEMLKQNGGAIVNMSSILGQVAFASSAAYVAAKHGVIGLSQNAAVEYARQGIRVNSIGPAFIDTPLL